MLPKKKGKVEETAWDLPTTAGMLQLYFFLFAFWQRCWWFPWKMPSGMWIIEWEGRCKGRMSHPCWHILLQCIVPSRHPVPVLLGGKLIWEKNSCETLLQKNSHKLLKITLGHLLGEKRGDGWREWQQRDKVKSEKVWSGDTQEQKENMTGLQLWRKSRRNQKAVVENNREVYNYYGIFLFWTLEQMLGSVFLNCQKPLWNALARYNLHSVWQSIGIEYAYTYKQEQTAVSCRCFCVKPGLMQKL